MDRAMQVILGRLGDPGIAGLGVLFAVGLFGCFLGYRFFRVSTALAGFVVGAELFGELALWRGWSPTVTMVLGLVGGVIVAVLVVLVSVSGIFGLGALVAATVVAGALAAAGESPTQWAVLVPAALVGGLGALAMRKLAVVVSLSLYGAMMAAAALFALVKDGRLSTAVRMVAELRTAAEVPLALGRVASPIALFLLCVAALATAGLVVQFRYGKNPRVDGPAEGK